MVLKPFPRLVMIWHFIGSKNIKIKTFLYLLRVVVAGGSEELIPDKQPAYLKCRDCPQKKEEKMTW